MIGAWLFWAIGVATLGFLTWLVGTSSGKKWARQKRHNLSKRTARISREAWIARRMATPRGRMRAERLRQPHRLTFGHRRPGWDEAGEGEGDSWRERWANRGDRILRRAVGRARLGWANRRRRTLLELLTPEQPAKDQYHAGGMCGSTKTDTGHPCRNLRMVGRPYCHVHKPRWIA
jgi:hypothetical protein